MPMSWISPWKFKMDDEHMSTERNAGVWSLFTSIQRCFLSSWPKAGCGEVERAPTLFPCFIPWTSPQGHFRRGHRHSTATQDVSRRGSAALTQPGRLFDDNALRNFAKTFREEAQKERQDAQSTALEVATSGCKVSVSEVDRSLSFVSEEENEGVSYSDGGSSDSNGRRSVRRLDSLMEDSRNALSIKFGLCAITEVTRIYLASRIPFSAYQAKATRIRTSPTTQRGYQGAFNGRQD
ncbi:hypothetical protein PLICRDRAFT_358455 [Plicaturopsis crispa FD-325 SS-3]|uniref:Uncharacterized protein n=1 Tax=Plicaturopsis crispa FD-325 SS-3 TaxID=944288 RepID=A0A0C9SKS7_PLICR|nr:hypothetical protein PLICRDRAFT_358455 [Plicaturopsis crispa FD-325 SS-3]